MERVYRARIDRKIAGVCGGLANYFDIDPVIVRLGWLLFVFVGGAGIIIYSIALFIMPQQM